MAWDQREGCLGAVKIHEEVDRGNHRLVIDKVFNCQSTGAAHISIGFKAAQTHQV